MKEGYEALSYGGTAGENSPTLDVEEAKSAGGVFRKKKRTPVGAPLVGQPLCGCL